MKLTLLLAAMAEFLPDTDHGNALKQQAQVLIGRTTEPDLNLIANKLQRPLAFFDLETTGTSTSTDRIVQMHITVLNPDTSIEQFTWLVNPLMAIPAGASEVHGITDEMIKDQPTFAALASEIYFALEGCDLAGFNSNHFDVPLLSEEFNRSAFTFPLPETKLIDVSNIFRKKEGRSLADCFMFYTGKTLEGAHDAGNDVKATLISFAKQLEAYDDLQSLSMDELHNLCKFNPAAIDLAGKLYMNQDGFPCFAQGKWKDQRIKDHVDYANWMLQADFPRDTKAHLQSIIEDCCVNN